MTTYLFIAGGVLLIMICGFWCVQRRTTRLRTAFQQRVSALEDALWRLQMNPHFLYNCLNSLNGMIHRDDKQSASHYLTILSRLVRKLLEHSEEAAITLADELDTVRQYIQMEQLRFGDKISVKIVVSPDIDPENILVPPLFIQPFVENALIHGLLPRQACGMILVEFCTVDKETFRCSVTDNGIGRSRSIAADGTVPSTNKSLGIAITCKRIAAFNKAAGRTLPFVIHDLRDDDGGNTGTSVAIQLARVSNE